MNVWVTMQLREHQIQRLHMQLLYFHPVMSVASRLEQQPDQEIRLKMRLVQACVHAAAPTFRTSLMSLYVAARGSAVLMIMIFQSLSLASIMPSAPSSCKAQRHCRHTRTVVVAAT